MIKPEQSFPATTQEQGCVISGSDDTYGVRAAIAAELTAQLENLSETTGARAIILLAVGAPVGGVRTVYSFLGEVATEAAGADIADYNTGIETRGQSYADSIAELVGDTGNGQTLSAGPKVAADWTWPGMTVA